ncbi:MAG: GMC family oxidoreductase N-terminal domain-containing protein [Alphaproteobacteria bacterium]
MPDPWDYIVVGAGSAGCVLANRLSADRRNRVLLLEAGEPARTVWLHIPAGYARTIGNPRTDWCLTTEPEPQLDGRRIPFPRGKGPGGSSAINGMIYTRGHARDYDGWRQLGCTGWDWNGVLPYFKRSEDFQDGASATHGAGGPLRVERQRVHWPFLDAFAAAARETGLPQNDDFNAGETEGVGPYHATQRRGRRCSAAAFLAPARGRPNLRILTAAQTTGLVLDGRRVTGVRYRRDGAERTADAARAVLLAAGVVHSPQILELSGIGDPAVLAAAGIAVRHALPGVGANLQDHLQARLVYRLNGVRTLNQRAGSRPGRVGLALQYALTRSGPLAGAPAPLGIFARSDPRRGWPDLQYHLVPYSADRIGGTPHPFPGVTLSVCQLRPESRGSIHIRSADPADPPAIRANYLAAEEDRRTMLAAVRHARALMAARALAALAPQEVTPGPAATADDAILAAVRATATTIFHPVGTCRMGTDAGAVVDPQLRVHGLDGLRVVDASVMPTVPSANTNAPTMMIAEKAADMIVTEAR